jgi:hypothetical protein
MENTTETSEASAEQSGADTTINANLSVDDLAASFVEKVEAQTEEPQSTTEATEDVTETEVVDAEEDQEGTVLSQSQSDDDDSEEVSLEETESDEAQPKGLTKALKQINRLTARAKGAEEEVATLRAQVESLKTQPTQETNTESQPVLENVQTVKDLEVLRKEAVAAKKWALQNLGKDYVEVDGREYDDESIRNILTEAEDFLTEKIPQRAQFIQQKQNWIQDTMNTFPWSAKGEGPEWELFQQIREGEQYKGLLDGLPNGDFVAATLVEGINSVKARQEQAKAKPKTKAKTPPPTDPADAVAPPVESKKVRSDKKRKAILGNGNVSVEKFAQYLNT